MTALLEVSRLSVSLGRKSILRDISFCVNRGEVFSIIGPNGAGKSTLVRAIAGLVRPESGELRLAGADLRTSSARQRARWISYVPQAHSFDAPYSALDLVLMARFAHFRGVAGPARSDLAAAKAALEKVGMASFAHRMLQTLSGGERQKVLIAAALAQEAPLLLLDEPLTFLDYRHQQEIIAILRTLRSSGEHTVLWVGHDLNQNLVESDRLLALREGRAVFFDTPEALLKDQVLQTIYEVPFDLVPVAGQTLPLVHPRHNTPGALS